MFNFFWTREKRTEVQPQEIYEAVSIRDHKQLKNLLSLANIKVINCENLDESALNLAVRQNDEISVELLLAHGAIPDYNKPVISWSKSVFFQATRNRNYKIIKLLVNHGHNLEKVFKENDPIHNETFPNIIPYNSWFKIVEADDLLIFQFLLECKNREISNDDWCQKILLMACGLGSNAIITYLLDRGVSIESVSDLQEWTGVFFAVACMKLTTVNLLITRGANLKIKAIYGYSLLHIIADLRDLDHDDPMIAVDIIQLLIDKGVDINATDIDGLTPINLLFKQKSRYTHIIELFLRQIDIDLVKPDKDGITVLHRAFFSEYFEDILFNVNVDINVKDKMGRTPLHFVNIDYPIIFLALLEFGADTNVLAYLNDDLLNHQSFMIILNCYRLMRSIAKLSNDHNVNALLLDRMVQCKIKFTVEKYADFVSYLKEEIERMKKTILCDKLTYYDFLHAKKRTCISVAKIPEMYDVLIKHRRDHAFAHYKNMLAKNYIAGLKPLKPIELQAMNSAEENLNIIFNNKLPNLIVYQIKKYIDIEDMVTLEHMKLFNML